MKQCPDCGNELSDKAKVCGNCGYKFKKKVKKKVIIIILLFIIILLLSAMVIFIINPGNIKAVALDAVGLDTVINKPVSPISDLNFESTYDDMIRKEGKPADTVTDELVGTVYKYDYNYEEMQGSLQYRFNQDNKLYLIGWFYNTKDVKVLSQKLEKELEQKYGKPYYDDGADNRVGYVWMWKWHIEKADVILAGGNGNVSLFFREPGSTD